MRALKLIPLLLVVAIVGVLFAVAVRPGSADAAPSWQVTLVSSDAGCTQTVKITPQTVVTLQAAAPDTCVKFGLWDGGSGADGIHGLKPDCTKDYLLQATLASPGKFTRTFDTGQYSSVAVCQSIDAGVATTNLYQNSLNKPGSFLSTQN